MPYETHGRTGQKSRTRTALVTAARELVSKGETPTVDRAAVTASVSRATAYRYFPNHRSLLAAAHPETDAQSLLGEDPPADPAARLDIVIRAFTRLIVETEVQQRTMLRLSLEPRESDDAPLPLRQGRAIGWITEALEPLREQLTDEGLRRLVLAVRSATGVESLVWLTDMAGLSRDDAVDLMRDSAKALLTVAMSTSSRPLSTSPPLSARSRSATRAQQPHDRTSSEHLPGQEPADPPKTREAQGGPTPADAGGG